MKQIEKGNYVKLCYTGKLENGEIFDQTDDCKSLEIEVGAGEVIKGLEDALIGMSARDRKSVIVSPDDGYGDRDERLQRTILRSNLAPGFDPEPGEIVLFKTPKGEQLPAIIKDIDTETITIDFNHPLAGKSLAFDLEVAEINQERSSAESECRSGCCCGKNH